MRPRHLAVALLVVSIWGTNFAFIQVALHTVPPLFLVFLRFALAAVPAIFFVRRPRIPFATLALYGVAMFVMQFGFLFTGMKAGVPAGLASLVLQVQVFLTMGLSVWIFGERPQSWRWAGAVIAFAGIGLVALHARGEVSLAGVGLLLLAALSWATGNIAIKRAGAVNPLALVVWGSALAAPLLLVLSLALEGVTPAMQAWRRLDLGLAGALAFIVYASTLLAFSLWAGLLRKYTVSAVAPFTLLVPVSGFLVSVLAFGERLPAWKLGAAALVIAGLALNVFGGRVRDGFAALRRPKVASVQIVE